MKKTILLFLIFLPFYLFFAQVIKGTVVDESGQRIPNTHIYLDGSKTGTVSKEDGSFILNLPSSNTGNIVFQRDDYDTFTAAISELINKTLKVVLTKTNAIEEIRLIPYTEEAYKNYINYFLDTFIGYDKENVKIKNQRTLKFSFDKKNKFLKVKAPKTLIIENKTLGYEIQYNLINYSVDFNTSMINYSGTSFFKETKNSDKVKLNRMNAFDGSLLHFFRSIYQNKIAEEGFIINKIVKIPNPKYPTEEELNTVKDFMQMTKKSGTIKIPEDISDILKRKNKETPYALALTKSKIPDADYTKRNGEQVLLSFEDMLQVNYKKYFYESKGKEFIKTTVPVSQSSYLHSEGETFEISKEGNITNPDLLINEGDFSKNKIENMLPLDYQLGD
ncbi:carboxypeptidase-like regulatory domain-containing protein [Chryseobacterium soli]|uniref:carboxypeptidase-like regulatory domain-containing protein n=1 Tax=Chryseobacterium soli TaxID=445961 RepID=UPI0005568ED2|nr:carboxypeptidase-like regulatory domain-containing protein [Chryseobacterium soli]